MVLFLKTRYTMEEKKQGSLSGTETVRKLLTDAWYYSQVGEKTGLDKRSE